MAIGGKHQAEDIYVRGVALEAIADPGNGGAIDVTRSGFVEVVTGGAETRTLAAPTFVGQQLILSMKTDGGDGVITVSAAFNASGNTTITLNDAGDCIELRGVAGSASALKWSQVWTNGPSLS